MNSKKGKQQKQVRSTTVAATQQGVANNTSAEYSLKGNRAFWQVIIITCLSFLLYGNSINFGYVLDDEMVITKNAYVQQGTSGLTDIFKYDSFQGYFQTKENLYLLEGGRYRPLSIASFAAEISAFGPDRPDVSHFINILLYAFTGIMLLRILLKLQRDQEEKKGVLSLAFVTTIIWIIHPIHTECVANIKGRDEILALIGALAALWASIRYAETGNLKWTILSGAFLFLALLSKENALTFLAVVPFTLWFFYRTKGPDLVKTIVPLVLAACLFIFLRYEALGYFIGHGKAITKLMNDPFLDMTPAEKYATIFYTLGWYIKLLFVPYPLTHDYYPYHVPKMNWADIKVILSLLVYCTMASWALYKIRSRNIYAYSILFFLITLSIVSNLIISVGASMNERFLYTPSLAFAIAIGYLFSE